MSSLVTNEFIPLSLSESLSLPVGFKHASHCLLYCKPDSTQTQTQTQSGFGLGLLQLRFDGLIGFAGGEVDVEDVTVGQIIEATNRELEEEINYQLDGVVEQDWICTHRQKSSQYVLHFFAKQLSFEQFLHLEKTHTNAQHFSSESLGVFRVPIGGSSEKSRRISKRFLNNFLRQRFAGNAKQQFIEAITKLSLLSPEDQKWIESNGFAAEEYTKSSIEVKALLSTELRVCYHKEAVVGTYGLMLMRDNGLFDFIGTDFSDSNDKNCLIKALNNSLKKDLGSDSVQIDVKSDVIELTSDNGLSNVFDIHLRSSEFTQIESNFVETENFSTKSFGILRIPFLFRGTTEKADFLCRNYIKRFFNGFFTQYFANNSKNDLKYIFENKFKQN